MAAVRPVLSVFKVDGSVEGQVKTPGVFAASLRNDIVHTVFKNMSKNNRQAYAVKHKAGMGHSAESWGTGRAVARIPRVSGGGTGRSGQAAFGNQCRKGRMFAPTKIWRRWHRHTSTNQRRFAVAAALAASAVPALVMARGHNIGKAPEVPLVIEDAVESFTKTKQAIELFKSIGAYDDVARAAASRTTRTGVGRMRSRGHSVRRGPLVVFAKNQGITRAFRNLPGVELAYVNSLNLLQLAPGGTLGRFVIWTKSAVEALHEVFGSATEAAKKKNGFKIAAPVMTTADLDRLISSNEIQRHLRAPLTPAPKRQVKLNPLTNFAARVRLNPYAKHLRLAELARTERAKKLKEANLAAARAGKPLVRSDKDAAKIARRKALRAQHKLNTNRLLTGQFAAENGPGLDKKVYKEAFLKAKTVGAAPKVDVKVGLSDKAKARLATGKKTWAAHQKNKKDVAAHVKKVRAKPAPKPAAAGKKK